MDRLNTICNQFQLEGTILDGKTVGRGIYQRYPVNYHS